jgi:hypothetical protein
MCNCDYCCQYCENIPCSCEPVTPVQVELACEHCANIEVVSKFFGNHVLGESTLYLRTGAELSCGHTTRYKVVTIDLTMTKLPTEEYFNLVYRGPDDV